ncbi:unnamed protein product, partial [Phaeothamnion confervicola]
AAPVVSPCHRRADSAAFSSLAKSLGALEHPFRAFRLLCFAQRCIKRCRCGMSMVAVSVLALAPCLQIGEVKETIERTNAELGAAAQQKLIHAGKVLKDDATVEESGIKENEFIVCM